MFVSITKINPSAKGIPAIDLQNLVSEVLTNQKQDAKIKGKKVKKQVKVKVDK